jgi:hypothetical protein
VTKMQRLLAEAGGIYSSHCDFRRRREILKCSVCAWLLSIWFEWREFHSLMRSKRLILQEYNFMVDLNRLVSSTEDPIQIVGFVQDKEDDLHFFTSLYSMSCRNER